MSGSDSSVKYENQQINGVNINDGGKLSKVIQGVWLKNAQRVSGSISSLKKTGSFRLVNEEDEKILKRESRMSNRSDSFTSNFDDVFDSPRANEIPDDYRASHPYNLPPDSNPYIERFNVHTPGGKNPFLSQSKNYENIVDIKIINTPEGSMSNRGSRILKENEVPITPLRANKPSGCRTPSIKLHTPGQGKCISLAHSRPYQPQQQQQEESPKPMPRTNPKCARFNSKGLNHQQPGTPYRYPGDGEQSPVTPAPPSTESFKPLHQVLSRTNTETGSLYQVDVGDLQADVDNVPSLEKSFNLVDEPSPAISWQEHLVSLDHTPVHLGNIFAAASDTPRDGDPAVYVPFTGDNQLSVQPREVSVDVTPAPTLCSSNYQAQLGSGLSAAEMSRNVPRDSVSSCQTHRLDLYQPPNPEEEKQYQCKLKIALGLIIIGAVMLISALIALIIDDPADII